MLPNVEFCPFGDSFRFKLWTTFIYDLALVIDYYARFCSSISTQVINYTIMVNTVKSEAEELEAGLEMLK